MNPTQKLLILSALAGGAMAGCSEEKPEVKKPVKKEAKPAPKKEVKKPESPQKAVYLIRAQIQDAERGYLNRTLRPHLDEAVKVMARTPSAFSGIVDKLENEWIPGESSVLKQLEEGQAVTYKGSDGKDHVITAKDYGVLKKSGELDSLRAKLADQRKTYALKPFADVRKEGEFEVFRFGRNLERCHNYNPKGKEACANVLDSMFQGFKEACHKEYGIKGREVFVREVFVKPRKRVNNIAGTADEAWVCWKKDNNTGYKAVTRVQRNRRGR